MFVVAYMNNLDGEYRRGGRCKRRSHSQRAYYPAVCRVVKTLCRDACAGLQCGRVEGLPAPAPKDSGRALALQSQPRHGFSGENSNLRRSAIKFFVLWMRESSASHLKLSSTPTLVTLYGAAGAARSTDFSN